MVKIISILTIVILAMGMLTACAQLLSNQPGSPTQVITPTKIPVPSDSALDDQLTVTLENQGKMISLAVGQGFLLQLGEDYTWEIGISDENVLSRVRNIAVVRGAQGIYDANASGTATLTALGEPVCRQAKPACGTPSIQFAITVVVQG